MSSITENDMLNCKYCEYKADEDGFYEPHCSKSGLPCDTVLRYGDEDCELQKGEVV